jgi:hypothetical protein
MPTPCCWNTRLERSALRVSGSDSAVRVLTYREFRDRNIKRSGTRSTFIVAGTLLGPWIVAYLNWPISEDNVAIVLATVALTVAALVGWMVHSSRKKSEHREEDGIDPAYIAYLDRHSREALQDLLRRGGLDLTTRGILEGLLAGGGSNARVLHSISSRDQKP